MAHDPVLHVGTDIVPVLGYRLMRGQLFQPDVIIMMQAGFIVVYEY
jgi:mannose/fructose/N-acetylgalactosamine-specific phosphotransferase system component IIC